MQLKEFQLKAVKDLFEAMDSSAQDIILKSPTGSGKTIILTYFRLSATPTSSATIVLGSRSVRITLLSIASTVSLQVSTCQNASREI